MNCQLSGQTGHYQADSWTLNLLYLSRHSELDHVTGSGLSNKLRQSAYIHYDQ